MKKCLACDSEFEKDYTQVCPVCKNKNLIRWTEVEERWEELDLYDFEEWCVDQYGYDLTEKILETL